ncbi:hypothetical protein Back2_10750 [Nocardioides baekrokdamisoli]|uniref:Cyclase n=1 Tax=Nocardioides baekrokdamisoli TaxID=1804624 RepID=A0A3G9IZL8_9ACTN|nr:hypothetical protein [Nocardioides baekrokdamisoli]BBH16788.1 hypothetical protein Back2_10750 [Nocardioides baekrokdamisoli]
MSGEIIERMLVRRDLDVVAKVATDPLTILPIIGGFGRFDPLDVDAAGCGLWDVFINLGTNQVGGRVEVVRLGERHLQWSSVRGTHHSMDIRVEPDADGAVVEFHLQSRLAGGLTGRISQFVSKGIVSRHLVAGLDQLRHYIEHEM